MKKIKNSIKGQAALEFMITYGWAIMSALIVVGALSYFGVFNTQRYTRDVCYFGDQLVCEDNTALINGTVKFQLRNNLGADINVPTVLIKSDFGEKTCSVNPSINIIAGSLFEVICVPTTILANNDKFKYKSIISFKRVGSLNLHNQTGDVITTVRDINP